MDSINEIFSASGYSDSNSGSSNKRKDHKLVELKALEIVEKLGRTPNSEIMPFYYKVVYGLSEAKVSYYLEIALNGRNPSKYFSFLVSKELRLGQFKDSGDDFNV